MDPLDWFYAWRRRFRAEQAARCRQRLDRATFIAITGSHGKSTATALLSAILSSVAPTNMGFGANNRKSFAKTIQRMSRKERFCVQEVSGSPVGTIEEAHRILGPSVGIVTAIGGDHRAVFRTWEDAAREKAKLVHGLPADGLAVLNADDPLVRVMAAGCRCRVVTFGRAADADLRLLEASVNWPHGLRLDVSYRGETFPVATRLVGTQWTVSVMAALLAALELGVDRTVCLAAVAALPPVFNRMSFHRGSNGAIYVLDGNKGSLSGVGTCMSFLADVSAPRKTVVVGQLADFGGKDRAAYNRVARLALAVADRVVFVAETAPRVRHLAASEEMRGRILMVPAVKDAADWLRVSTDPGEVVYIKGAHIDHLERLFLAQVMDVRCWVERCGIDYTCTGCRKLPMRVVPASVGPVTRF